MDELGFRQWLITTKSMGNKSARDVVSRCRRIEKTFGTQLVEVVQSEKEMSNLTTRLKQEASSYLKPGTNPIYGVAVVRRAARLYEEYHLQKASLER